MNKTHVVGVPMNTCGSVSPTGCAPLPIDLLSTISKILHYTVGIYVVKLIPMGTRVMLLQEAETDHTLKVKEEAEARLCTKDAMVEVNARACR